MTKSLASANEWLKYLPLIGFALLAGKMLVSGLWRTYRWFSAYLLTESLRIVLGLIIPARSNLYAYLYFVSEPLVWLLSMLAVLEIYGMVLKDRPGITNLGRKAVFVAMALSLVVAAAMSSSIDQHPEVQYRVLHSFFLLSRFVTASLLLFLLLITAVLVWFPISLNRNTVLHCCLFAVFFLLKVSMFVILTVIGQGAYFTVNDTLLITVTLCTGAWLIWLGPEGETVPVKVGHSWNREEEARLLAQLDSINRTLLNSAKD
jgi:hypothetical protein